MRFLRRLALLAIAPVAPAFAQENPPPPARDPQIEKIVRDVSAERIEATIRQLVAFQTRHTLSTTTDPKVGIGAARTWLKGEFDRIARESGGRLQVELDAFHQPPQPPRIPQGADIVNLVATLPGRQPAARDRVYVVSGHYDSIVIKRFLDGEIAAPGADDDGSGTAAVLELARVMSHYDFDATIVFLAVAAEEQALNGSTHWAKAAKEKNLNIAAMFTNDIVGNTLDEHGVRDRSHVRLFAEGVTVPAGAKELPADVLAQIRTGGENDFPTRQLARAIQAIGARYVPELPVKIIYRRDRYLRGGDHSPFLDAGFAAVRFTEPHEVFARQHEEVREENGVRYGDTIDFVDFGYVADVARVNAAALAELADAPASPRGVKIETTKLENDTTLRWQPNAEPDLAGYRIVWRDTTALQWEHALEVPKTVTRYTVPGVSKDNVIFGVEAVDTAGHASPAVYP
ncbi:MAG TPA: M28 family metallopeptidase [Opitutaceae bacterium]|nr:M28 family metallopeptidase [Opitutaceae bacterium]